MVSSRSSARLVRFGVFALVLIFCGYILTKGSSYSPIPEQFKNAQGNAPAGQDSNDAVIGNTGSKPVSGSSANSKVKATFVTLARNSDLNGLSESIRQVEDRFNKNFHYDWVFLNEEPFSDEFKNTVNALTSGVAKFGLIPKEQWSYPEWIDLDKAALAREELVRKKVIYGGSEPYRHMCRFESGFFFRHELLDDYEYYWRVEPDVKIYCDIDYDVFKFMRDNGKWYGWTISLPEYSETIPTLWETTKKFMKANPQYIASNNNMDWISDDNGETYNGCHFWSNFEVGYLDFFRSEAYLKFFRTLDEEGGFFYERWGDAPVHSIAASILMSRDKLQFFGDLGYYHVPFHNCPIDDATRLAKKCVCNKNDDFTWKSYSCTPRFFTLNNMKRPSDWEQFSG